VKATRNCIIITNKTTKTWKFGYFSLYEKDKNPPQSGTFEFSAVDDRLKYYDKDVKLKPDSDGPLIPANYGALVLRPKCERVSALTWKPFFRVCYIEDESGNRILLNIAKGTRDSDTPTVGLAQATYKTAMANPQLLALHSPRQAKDPKLNQTNVLAIGADSVYSLPRK